MNILMIFRNNPLLTAGAVTFDLFNEFKAKGHTVKLLVNTYDADYPEGIISMESFYRVWINRIQNKIKRIVGREEKRATDDKYHFHELAEQKTFYKTDELLKKAGIRPDVIIILFAKNFINAKNIYELHNKTGKPVYLMMYDTAPLTGGCHYSWDCVGYQDACGKCPGLFSNDPFDISNINLLYKKKYMDMTDVHIVLASEWQYQQAKKSAVFKNKPIHKILISINPDVFNMAPKTISRNKFGIAPGKKVLFFGATTFKDERKGFNYLLESLNILKKMLEEQGALKDNILLLIAGNESEKINELLPFEYHNLGFLNNSDEVASAYQAADIYLCSSVEDAGPSMVNQSLMSGTPVVSFAQGVSLDLVVTGKTGYLARLKDSEDMARGIYDILNLTENEYLNMKTNCRTTALELYHPEVSINSWLNILKPAK